MTITQFQVCIVCGGDVLTLQGSPTLPMCATHSAADKNKALDHFQWRLNNTRDQVISPANKED